MRARIEELTKEIDDGKWSVSMECVFNNFDYALIGPNEDQKVLARTDESSFLTKHLRAYGGSGEFQGYKIGRLLRGYYFSGKGLVTKPANTRSIILNKDANPFNSKADITFYNFLTAMENNMKDTTKPDVSIVNEDVAKEASANEIVLAEKEKAITSLEAKVKELEGSFAGINGEKEKLAEEVEALKQSVINKEEELKAIAGKYSAIVKEMKGMKRVASLLEAGADEQKANKIVEDFSDASDEMFASVVALLGDKKSQPDTNTKPETKPEPAPVDFGSEGADDDDSEEADASELDGVGVAESALANPESSQEGQNVAIASAAAWLRKSVLKSTKSLK